MTPADIKRQHERAMASLTPEQRLALSRERLARNAVNMNGGTLSQALERLFALEAADYALFHDPKARVA